MYYILFLLFAVSWAQNLDDYHKSEAVKSWIFFHDKNNTDSHSLYYESDFLTENQNIYETKGNQKCSEEYKNIIRKIAHQENEDYYKEKEHIITTSNWLNAISVKFKPSTFRKILRLNFVESIQPVNKFMKPKTTSTKIKKEKRNLRQSSEYGDSYFQLQQTNIPEIHSRGYIGSGVKILVLDTGLYKDHEAFQNLNLTHEKDFVNDDDNVQNEGDENIAQHNHGTNIVSILAGNSPGNILGAAYGAEILFAKVEEISADSTTEEDFFVAGLEWGVEHGADIAVFALGYPTLHAWRETDGKTTPSTIAANIAGSKGVILVGAIGNDGVNGGGVTAPSDSPFVIAVGGVLSTNEAAPFSSTGPTFDGRIKPDLVALGDSVVSVAPRKPCSSTESDCSDQITSGSYGTVSGTSMATPIVAGLVALMLQKNPTWTPQEIRLALTSTANSAKSPNVYTGWGIPDASLAMDYVRTGDCRSYCKFGTCSKEICYCHGDGYHPDCSQKKMGCESYCENGSCQNNVCQCTLGYSGILCDISGVTTSSIDLSDAIVIVCILLYFIILGVSIFLYVLFSKRKLDRTLSFQVKVFIFFWAAVGVTLMDIILSLTVFKTKYYVTGRLFWEAVEFIWKFLTCLIIFGKIASKTNLLKYAAVGALVHIIFALPVSWIRVYFIELGFPGSCNNHRSLWPLAGEELLEVTTDCTSNIDYIFFGFLEILVINIFDYAVLPKCFRILQKRNPEVRSKAELKDLHILPNQDQQNVKMKSPIAILTYVMVASTVGWQLISFLGNFRGWYMSLFVIPVVVIFFLDRKKAYSFNYHYTLSYLFLTGTFILFPVSLMTDVLVSVQTSSFSEIWVRDIALLACSILYIVVLQLVTLFIQKAAKNSTNRFGFIPLIFRSQFFEDFASTLLYYRRDYQNWVFWGILIFQCTWTVLRNSGIIGILLKLISAKFSSIDTILIQTASEKLAYQGKKSEQISRTTLLAIQYALCDLIAVIAIPAQFYTFTALLSSAARSEYTILVTFVLLGVFKCISHVIVFIILKKRSLKLDGEVETSEKEMTETSLRELFVNHIHKFGFFFTVITFVSTADSFLAVDAIFAAQDCS